MTYLEATDPACETCSGDDGVALVVNGQPRPVGSVTVSRVLPTMARRMIGPFVFLDHLGPVTFPPGTGFDVPPHPHIGLSTVTYEFEGTGLHRDSMGNVQLIAPGDVNLMTAGSGVVHSERTPQAQRASGGVLHGLQFWVALTLEEEEGPPSFVHVDRGALPRFTGPGVTATVVLGEAFGLTSPLAHASQPVLVDAILQSGSVIRTPATACECGAYVVAGSVRIGTRVFGAHTLLVTSRADVPVHAVADSRVIILGGPALGKRFIDWNFVASSKERLQQARDDWKARRFPPIPGDDVEFVPYPEPRRHG
jgi:redox-sensitive bicupin YhaK (pirin superfamily)